MIDVRINEDDHTPKKEGYKKEVLVDDQKLENDWKMEENHLNYSVKVINNNIDKLSAEYKKISEETKILYDNYRSNNPELHNDLVIGLSMQSQTERALNKNKLALKKPYFGRIDYVEHEEKKKYSLYIGKHGISKSSTEIVIVDWRAPISSVYYESDIGESSYKSPFGEVIDVSLNLKRTFEISDSKLVDFYDSDVIANDEFLTKYLGKNKDVVLGEIIATIQKEQNEIIRDVPFHNVIVQGVAGSGKTTVAMHRISYILYNFKERFRSDEFFIIGSNKMLLNYITGVLPHLDVYNINQMTMEEFFLDLLDKDFNLKKEKYIVGNSFTKLRQVETTKSESIIKRFKGSIHFIKALEVYFDQYELNIIPTKTFIYHEKELYSKEEITDFLNIFKEKPLLEKIQLLNKRLSHKIRLENERTDEEKYVIQNEIKKYKNYFGNHNAKTNVMEIYKEFLDHLVENRQKYLAANIQLPEKNELKLLITNLNHKQIDLYDFAMLTYIKRRLRISDDFKYVSHIVVDEAQDFGVLIFYVLKHLFTDCTYTIMGDITQNIHYDTGMNDWETLKTDVMNRTKDKFYCLAKSYRNTVEISNYASNVLKHCTFKTYEIEPIIRHGKEVTITKCANEKKLVSNTVNIIKESQRHGYTTIAVICRTEEETFNVQDLLSNYIEVKRFDDNDASMGEMVFTNGVMVLPIHMTKGLEFDSVILWNPDEIRYHANDADAKLLYVAITRALHELNVVYQDGLSKLLI